MQSSLLCFSAEPRCGTGAGTPFSCAAVPPSLVRPLKTGVCLLRGQQPTPMGPSPLGHLLRWTCQSCSPPSPVFSRDKQGLSAPWHILGLAQLSPPTHGKIHQQCCMGDIYSPHPFSPTLSSSWSPAFHLLSYFSPRGNLQGSLVVPPHSHPALGSTTTPAAPKGFLPRAETQRPHLCKVIFPTALLIQPQRCSIPV